MDPTDTRSPPTPTAAGVRRHAAAYVADLLATCQLRGAFTLEEADGLLGVVRGLETLAATEEEETDDNDTEVAHTDDAEGGHGDDHGQATDTPDPTRHCLVAPRLGTAHAAQARKRACARRGRCTTRCSCAGATTKPHQRRTTRRLGDGPHRWCSGGGRRRRGRRRRLDGVRRTGAGCPTGATTPTRRCASSSAWPQWGACRRSGGRRCACGS